MLEKPSPKSPFANENGVIVFAHRGGSGRWPENTMFAFRQAADLGVDALELDIHSTADHVLVVIHDPFVDRISNGRGPVRSFTLAALKELDAGYRWTDDDGQTYPFRGKGLTIPTLEEVFSTFPHLWINIDIKQSDPPIVTPFVKMIRDFNMGDRVMAGSFDTHTVAQFRRECPEVETAASLTEARRMFILSKLSLGRFYWGDAAAMQIPEYAGWMRVVSRRFVETAHRWDTAVHVWTVDETADMQRLIDLGVDGLMTDYPHRLLKLLGRLT